LIQQLQQSGLGDQVASWVSTGANKPVSPDQVQQALGDDKIQQMSQQTGMSGSDVAAQLAQLLPQLINHATPNGEVPAHSDVQSLLGGLLKSIG
jgi:uncharacterized protein YidB (DUF937 family)